jgi:hypothetical protein
MADVSPYVNVNRKSTSTILRHTDNHKRLRLKAGKNSRFTWGVTAAETGIYPKLKVQKKEGRIRQSKLTLMLRYSSIGYWRPRIFPVEGIGSSRLKIRKSFKLRYKRLLKRRRTVSDVSPVLNSVSDWTGAIGQDHYEDKICRVRSFLNALEKFHKTLIKELEKKLIQKYKESVPLQDTGDCPVR